MKKRFCFKTPFVYLADNIHNSFVNEFTTGLKYKVIEDTAQETYDEKTEKYYITIEYSNEKVIKELEKKIKDYDDYLAAFVEIKG